MEHKFVSFTRLLGFSDISFRCVAESEKLLKLLDEKEKKGERVSRVEKILESTEESLEKRISIAEKLNSVGFAVYYMPQKYKKGYSETYSDITALRSLVVDLDGAPFTKALDAIPPQVIVESSVGKYQLVYVLEQNSISVASSAVNGSSSAINIASSAVDDFNDCAAGLAAYLDGDLNAARATQAFRAPGFNHLKRDSREVKVLWHNIEKKSYRLAELSDFLKLKRSTIKKLLTARGGEAFNVRHKTLSQAIKVDLEALRTSEVLVKAGERHNTLLRLSTKLFLEGKSKQSVDEIIRDIIEKKFEGAEEFLTGKRQKELEIIKVASETYVNGVKAEELARYRETIEKKKAEAKVVAESPLVAESVAEEEVKSVAESLPLAELNTAAVPTISTQNNGSSNSNALQEIPETLQENSVSIQENLNSNNGSQASSFEYDFSTGTMAQNRFSETALVARVIQKWGKRLVKNVQSGVAYCFSPKTCTWEVQDNFNTSELKVFVLDCIRDIFSEEEFLAQFITKKGEFSDSHFAKAKSVYYRINTINSVCKAVINNIALQGVNSGDFDSNEELLFCANGVLNLRTGELRAPEARDLLLRRSKVIFDKKAKAPGFSAFLKDIFQDNDEPEELIEFVAELLGYSISGCINAEKIFCHLGDGRNGKSKLLSSLRLISGDYSTILEPGELVVGKSGFERAFERVGAKVEGSRVVIIDDFDVDASWNEAFVKLLTGHEFRARAEYQRSRVVVNRASFHIGLNKAPRPQAENTGILARLCIIPYERTFASSGAASKRIDGMIRAEASGILNLAMEGFRRFVERGCELKYPRETIKAVETYRKEHFSVENDLNEVIGVPEEGEAGEELSLEAIVEKLSKNSSSRFDRNSLDTLRNSKGYKTIIGIHLRRLGVKSRKVWNSEKQNMSKVYLVKFK